MTFTWCNWLWWRAVDHRTIHNLTIHNKRIRSYDTGWWRRDVVTMGSGEEGKWWRRKVVMKGSGEEGKWGRWEVVRKGSGDKGKWWWRGVVRKGVGEEGKWWGREVPSPFWLRNVLRATTAYTFSTSQLPKVVRTPDVLYMFTSKCASRHNGVHFFDIATSKSDPKPWCFVLFHFEMCFAPQRHALFRHLNFQKWSEPLMFCTFSLRNVLRATTACTFRHLNFQKWSESLVILTFWLRNVLRATTACTFSTSQLPKVIRTPDVLYILSSKCASRHNGVQFFISHLASWLRTRRVSEPTFGPSGASNHWKNTVFRDFPTFSRICIFFLLTLSLLLFSLLIFLFYLPLPCAAFHLSILSEVWLLNFLRSWLIMVNGRFPSYKPPSIWGFPESWG